MKIEMSFLALIGALLSVGVFNQSAIGCGIPKQPLSALAQQAVSGNKLLSLSAIAQLRAKGPEGLEALLRENSVMIREHETQAGSYRDPTQAEAWTQFKTAVDAVSGQFDCYASRLFWYTDFESAKAAAKASGKPILTLRLLGKLNEEYSCANSRFFRTTLYANTQVSEYLRDHFILHWQSVRPVPRITIDFGDGRKIEQTITGNSAHYILDSDGELVDALPGLYGPKAFLLELQQGEQLALACAGLSADQKRNHLVEYHSQQLEAAQKAWNADLTKLGEPSIPLPVVNLASVLTRVPSARAAGEIAFSKRAIEAPLLKSTQPPAEPPPGRASISNELWARIAALHTDEARLDTASLKLIASKLPSAVEASRLATSKQLVESPALRTLRNLQSSIGEDTVRNEYLLHAQIHNWFVENAAPANLDLFNSKVYAELFLMPDSDPWLGLAPANVFTALPNQGLVQASNASGGAPSAAN